MNITRNVFKRVCNVLCLVLALLSASCVNKISDEIQESNIPITFSTKTSKSATKATNNTFETGDRMGIFAMLTGNDLNKERYIDNLLLECGEGTTLLPQKEVYYPEGDATLDFISYYPYQTNGISEGGYLLNVTVQTDQSKSSNYSLSNFMTARTENVANNEETVQLEYKHQFAKIKLVLTPKEGENADDMLKANPKIIATGFKTQAVYDLQSDKLSKVHEESETDIIPAGVWKKDGNGLSGKEFIVIPQIHSDSEQAFTLEWNGKIYACSLPSATIKEDTELEIRIDALQSTSETLTGIIANIKEWGYSEQGESENKYDITTVHTASFSFKTSDVYRIYYQGKPVAEVCREFLNSTVADAIYSKAIVVYPMQDNEQTDLSNGLVLQLPDKEAMIHGGKVSWDKSQNSLTYTAGHSKPIEKFYINGNKEIVTEKPSAVLAINISNYVIRDIRFKTPQIYPIVKIGTQYWMKEDLRATYYNNRESIPLRMVLGQGGGYFKQDNFDAHFYNGEAVLTGKLAPADWKIPTENDWNRLIEYIGGSASTLKKAESWSTDTYPATNESGFNSQPRGLILENEKGKTVIVNSNSSTAYWVYDGTQKQLDKTIMLDNKNNGVEFKTKIKPEGKDYYNAFSIRCIKE